MEIKMQIKGLPFYLHFYFILLVNLLHQTEYF